jgi:hypothetical protein
LGALRRGDHGDDDADHEERHAPNAAKRALAALDQPAPADIAPSKRISAKVRAAKPRWQTAAHELIMAAERGGILMLAEIAIRQALAHGRPKPAPAPRKKAARKYRIVR